MHKLHQSQHHSLNEVEEPNDKNGFFSEKGSTKFPPRCMPNHVSGDTYVDQQLEKKKLCRIFYTVLTTLLLIKDIHFGLSGGCDL
jgi:hypothetical protein